MATLKSGTSEVRVSTLLLSSFHCRVGQSVQVIGEVEERVVVGGGEVEVVIVARVSRGLEEWDEELYEAVVRRKRTFEQRMGLQ